MQNLNEFLKNFVNMNLDRMEFQTDILQTVLIIVVLWLLRFVIIKVVDYETTNLDTRYWWAKITSYVVFFVGLILVGRIWIGGTESLVTFLGLVSAGLAIALAGPVTDLAGWIYVLSRRPFVIGDRIQIGDHAGDVIDIRVFQFAVLEIGNWVEADQSTGRIIHIPYRKIFSEVLANYSEGFDYIWNEIPIRITFESNWEKAKAIFQDIADRHAGDLPASAAQQVERASHRFPIMFTKLTPIVYTGAGPHGVILTIRYLTQIRQRRSTEQAIWEDVLRAVAQHPDIGFAYPTQRIYANWLEGPQPTEGQNKLAGVPIEEIAARVNEHNQKNSKLR